MKRSIIYPFMVLLVIGLITAYFVIDQSRAFQPAPVVLASPLKEVMVAAPGRVEPISEEIKVGSELSGRLVAVLVEEGDLVRRGQPLAVLENSEYRARLASAEAMVKQKESELRRVLNGARDQERREAWATVMEARAKMENSIVEMERRKALHRDGVVAREEADRAGREYQVEKARYEAAIERHALIDDKAREEDQSKAEADVELARAQLDEAKARLEKTTVRSPISGIVLQKHLKAGENVVNSNTSSMPIVTVADITRLRVRADIDETDIGKIKLGQKAYVKADAYGDKKFFGKVVRIGQVLGKKNIRTDEPTERVDTKILETLIEIDADSKLPSGLRVDAFVNVSDQRE
jgi:HlyD family secretion protein